MATAPSTLLRLRRFALALLLVLAVGYALIVGLMFAGQRGMLYFPPRGAEAPPAGSAIQGVLLTTADHQTLRAWYLPPRAGQPVMLFFGGNGDALAPQAERWRLIGEHGAGFLAVSYCGYSGSTGKPTEAGLTQDARAAYAWLAARYLPAQIVIHGHSLGTGVAVRLAAEHPARALILESPFTSTVDVAAELYPWAPVRLLMLDRYPSADLIGKVRMPILIVHGDRDEVVPFHFGQALYAAAPSPKRFVRIPGGDHNGLDRLGLYDDIWAFLAAPPAR